MCLSVRVSAFVVSVCVWYQMVLKINDKIKKLFMTTYNVICKEQSLKS